MSKLLPGLAIGLSLAVFPLASVVLPASAKDQTVTVTIGGTFADDLAAALGVDAATLPASVTVPTESVRSTTVVWAIVSVTPLRTYGRNP